jgi:hypothetical protein
MTEAHDASETAWPAGAARTPNALLEREDLSRERKIAILRQWELDLRERMVAEEENMPAAEPMPVALEDVLDALQALGAGADEHPVPTTHG